MRPYELAKKYNRDSGTIIGKLQDVGVYKFSLHHFTEEEINMLKIYYPIGDWDTIRRFIPNVSRNSIHNKMHDLGVSAKSYYWNEEDISILKQSYETMYGRVKELVDLFNGKYSYKAICTKAHKLGLKSRTFWSDEEIRIMKNNYSKKTVDEMLLLLPERSRHSIIAQAIKLGLKNCCKYQKWEVQFIIDNWETMSDEEMANKLSKTLRGLKAKRESMGLFRVKEKSCYSDIYEFLRKKQFFLERRLYEEM